MEGVLEREVSSLSIDEKRRRQVAYEYLCHLEEAKLWLEHNLHIELPPSTELESYLRSGVVLAVLANFFAPSQVPVKKIYDIDFLQFQKKGLHFKHTDNIIHFIKAMEAVSFPKVFYPETTDIYDMKNMPKLVYCLHALSMFLAKMGLAAPIQNLLGVVEFDEADIIKMSQALEAYGVHMPAFSKIGGILASELSENDAALHAAIVLINEAIELNDRNLFIERVKAPSAQIFNINNELIDNYFSELITSKKDKNKKFEEEQNRKSFDEEDVYDRILTQSEIQNIITDINIEKLMVDITLSTRAHDSQKLIECLVSRDLAAPNVKFDNRDLYLEVFEDFLLKKESTNNTMSNDLNNHIELTTTLSTINTENLYTFKKDDVFNLINSGNKMADTRNRIYNFIQKLNEKIDSLTPQEFIDLVTEFNVDIGDFIHSNVDCYLQVIRSSRTDGESLWFDKVKKAIKMTNTTVKTNLEMLEVLEKLNNTLMTQIQDGAVDEIFSLLQKADIKGLTDECKTEYASYLHDKLKIRNFHDWDGWCTHKMKDSKTTFKFNHKTRLFNFQSLLDNSNKQRVSTDDSFSDMAHIERSSSLNTKKPESNSEVFGYMNYFDITDFVREVTQQYNREMYILANVNYVQLIQAFYRTVKLHFPFIKLPHIKMIQGLYRSMNVLLNLKSVHANNRSNLKEIVLLQDYYRTIIVMRPFLRRISYFKDHKNEIIALQSIIRACQAHADYNNLVHNENPSCKAVSKFVRLLEYDSNDLKEEKELSQLKQCVLDRIREVNELEAEIKDMDVRIGLLVKNRLQVQDVIGHNQAKKKKNRVLYLPTMTKEKQVLIEKYGQVLYILQTNPYYTSKIILSFTGNRSSSFIKETCYALYNYGTNIRDEYTIINMFAKSLELEVLTKIDTMQEFTRGDPIVIRMVIVFWRNSKAQTWIEEILKTAVKDVLNNKYNINTNPIEIYKQWIAQLETETGQTTGKPYDVDAETALTYEEVTTRLRQNIKTLTEVCDNFVNSIVSNSDKIPYGLRYIAKILYKSLEQRFPEATTVEYIKIVGNLLYYRLINPGITAPDDYKIAATAEINVEKRKNLAFIASILQKSAAKNFYFDSKKDSESLSLDHYMDSTWNKFSNWVERCIDVEDISIHFNMDEFTDQAAIQRPSLNLKVSQILEVHKIINQMEDELFNEPKENDVLYKVIKSFTDGIPTISEIAGPASAPSNIDPKGKSGSASGMSPDDGREEAMLNAIINIPLISPTVDTDNEESRRKQLFLETMQYVIDLMYFEPGDNLGKILQTKFSSKQEEAYIELQKNRYQIAGDLKNFNNNRSDESKSKKSKKTEDANNIPQDSHKALDGSKSERPSSKSREKVGVEKSAPLKQETVETNEEKSDNLSNGKSKSEKSKKSSVVKDQKSQDSSVNPKTVSKVTLTNDSPSKKSKESIKSKNTNSRSSRHTLIKDASSNISSPILLNLEETKQKVLINAKQLEEYGMCSSSNNYESLVVAIAKEIRNRRQYRKHRRFDLLRLRSALDNLDSKNNYLTEQLDSYNLYVKACVDNMQLKGKKGKGAKAAKRTTMKYSAAKLHSLGVILEIEGLSESQFKNVLFEISSTDDPGVFSVSAKLFGVNMESLDLVLHDLLQLQYENVTVMKLFDRAKVNVNLLIYTINKKFFTKKK